jgi:hypothetical protein
VAGFENRLWRGNGEIVFKRKSQKQIKLGDMPSLNNRVRLTYGHRNLLQVFKNANLQYAYNLRVAFMPAQTNRVRNTYSVRNLLNHLDYRKSRESTNSLSKLDYNDSLELDNCGSKRYADSQPSFRGEPLSDSYNLPTDSRQLLSVPKTTPL